MAQSSFFNQQNAMELIVAANWSNECPSNDRFNNFRVEISVPPDWLHHALVQVNDALKPSLATMDFKEGVEAIKKAIYFASRSQTLKERD
jgi:hypothetical protein